MADLTPISYAQEYAQALANAFPDVLHFGALYATPNNGRYRMGENGKGVYIPRIYTGGRTDANRDTITLATRNYHNSWEYKPLTRERKWSTSIHPENITQSGMTATIENILNQFNNQNKFAEMDAYVASRLYYLYTHTDAGDSSKVAKTADTTALTIANILTVFDAAMTDMDEANVPADGRILYCTPGVKRVIQNADKLSRSYDVSQAGRNRNIDRTISRLDEVELVSVPSKMMKTAYDFTDGYKPYDNAGQINFILVHPEAVITPVSYDFAELSPPSALSEGKWVYYEESHEDVFILNERQDALFFNITAASGTYTAVVSPTGNPSTSGYYEKSGDYYFASLDTTVDSNKTYYTKS